MMHAAVVNSTTIRSTLVEHSIIPDVADEFTPTGVLAVAYPQDIPVAAGNTLHVAETQSLPRIQYIYHQEKNCVFQCTASDLYTLVVTDPDAPSRGDKKWSEYCHYIVSDLNLFEAAAAGEHAELNSDTFFHTELPLGQGRELVPYMGPGPPPKTGKHRYVFLLYKQKSGVKPEAPSDRPNWGTGKPGSSAREWAAKYGLELVTCNFFYAQNLEQ